MTVRKRIVSGRRTQIDFQHRVAIRLTDAGSDPQRACARVKDGCGTEGHGELIRSTIGSDASVAELTDERDTVSSQGLI